jgi:hypothetical protein
MAEVAPPIRKVFDDIRCAITGMKVKEYPTTAGKLGLRFDGQQVVLTYNSYKRGWLDTRAELGTTLRWFRFQPTHNKPNQYWAVKLTPDKVQSIYQAHREEILAALCAAHGVVASTPAREVPPSGENSASHHFQPSPAMPAPTVGPETVQQCFLSVYQCTLCPNCARQFPELDSSFPPQPGFVGARYHAASPRIMLLAQNPGHASRAAHSPNEARMYDLWKKASETRTDEDFGKCMAFLREFMESWPIIEKARLRERFALSLDDVVYTNILKCKTRENKQPSAGIYKTCLQQTTCRQIEVLSPAYLLCFGKAVFEEVEPVAAKLGIRCNWILHPSGQHYRPTEQQERVSLVAADLADIRRTR